MKKFKAPVILFLALSLLAGCSENTADTSYGSAPAVEPESHTSSSSPVSEPEASSDISVSSTTSKTLTKAEAEQMVACFKEWAYLEYDLPPCYDPEYFPECVDKSQFITEMVGPGMGNDVRRYPTDFYKVVSGDYATEAGFNKTLGKMFTEKFKKIYMGSSSPYYLYRFKDGEMYVSYQNEPHSLGPKQDLNVDIKYLDDNSVAVTIPYDNDRLDKYSAVFVKGDDGNYRIDDVGEDDSSLFHIPALFYDKTVNITFRQDGNVLFTL